MLVGNLQFSVPAILEWEMANSVVGSAAAAVTEEAESPVTCTVRCPTRRRARTGRGCDSRRLGGTEHLAAKASVLYKLPCAFPRKPMRSPESLHSDEDSGDAWQML